MSEQQETFKTQRPWQPGPWTANEYDWNWYDANNEMVNGVTKDDPNVMLITLAPEMAEAILKYEHGVTTLRTEQPVTTAYWAEGNNALLKVAGKLRAIGADHE